MGEGEPWGEMFLMVNRQVLESRWTFGGQKGASWITASVASRKLIEGWFHVLRKQVQGEECFRQYGERVVRVREEEDECGLECTEMEVHVLPPGTFV